MKRNKWIFSGLVIVFIVTMVILIPLRADTDKDKKKRLFPKVDEETLKLVKTIQVWKLVTEVSLSEEQLVSFLPVFHEQETLKWNYWHEKRDAVEKLKDLEQKDNVSEERLKQALDEYNEFEDEYNKKLRTLDKKLMSKLTLRQRVKYILFKDSYHRDLRKTLIKIKELGKKEKQPALLREAKPKKDK